MEPSVKVKAGRTTQEQWLITYVGIFVTMASVYAWDDAGHLLTAQIAYDRLSPAAQQSLQAQLSGLTEGAHTYNAISAACYMDDLRRDKNVDGSWHYIAPPFGHAVTAVGYDDAKKRFLLRNSWGPNWGVQGYFTMPYAYLGDRNLSDDFWTVRVLA